MHVALETTTVFRLRVFVCCSVFVTCEGGYMRKKPPGCYNSRRQCEAKFGTEEFNYNQTHRAIPHRIDGNRKR